jgi:hypothetical protein
LIKPTILSANKSARKYSTGDIALIGLLAATLTGGKAVLSVIPNVEVVTLLITLYAVRLGLRRALPATLIFCAVESLIWGFQYYLVTYFIYWPCLAVFAYLISKRTRAFWAFLIYAVLMTVFFGILSSFIDTLFMTSRPTFRFFFIRYLNGIPFYTAQIICNIVLFATAFKPLSELPVFNRYRE